MKIDTNLAEQIISCVPQLQVKFDISIGYSHPAGCFIDNKNDFIIYQSGSFNDQTQDFDFGLVYIIEYNSFEIEHQMFLTKVNTDLEQTTERITDFLIDFVQWVKNGKLCIYEYQIFGDWQWKPVGDGRFSVVRRKDGGRYYAFLGQFDPDDRKLEEHISNLYGLV